MMMHQFKQTETEQPYSCKKNLRSSAILINTGISEKTENSNSVHTVRILSKCACEHLAKIKESNHLLRDKTTLVL